MIYEDIYKKLDKLEILDVTEYERRTNEGYMDLNIDRLNENTWTLSHNFEMNGDLVPDPDMKVKVYPDGKMAEALTFQDQFGYRAVYPEPGKIDLRAKKELNEFLNQWLSNLLIQHKEEK